MAGRKMAVLSLDALSTSADEVVSLAAIES